MRRTKENDILGEGLNGQSLVVSGATVVLWSLSLRSNLCVTVSPVIERLCLCALGSACSHALRVSQADNQTKQGVPMATPHQILCPSPHR